MAGPIAFTQVRYKLINDDGPYKYLRLEPGSTQITIPGVERLNTYTVEARNVGPTGLVSRWVDLQQQVAGAEEPDSPFGLVASKLVNGALLRWQMPPGTPSSTVYEVHRAPDASGAPGAWAEVGTTGSLSFVDPIGQDGVYWYRINAKNRFDNASATFSNQVSVDLLTEAELEANILAAMNEELNKIAVSDGAVNTFWQPEPPPIGDLAEEGKVGDIWFDTNDNDRVYRCRDGEWKLSPNDALAESIKAASNAQSTADGKVKLYVLPATPVGTFGLNDLWFNTTTKTLLRWNGSDWNERVADITLDQIGGRGINLLPDEYSTFQNEQLPPSMGPGNGTLSRDTAQTIVPGSASVKLTQTAGNEAYVYLGNYNVPHTQGRKYLISAYFASNAEPRNIQAYVQMANGAHVDLGLKTKTTPGHIRNTRLTWVADLSAQTSDSFRIRFDTESGAGATLHIDGAMVEELIGNKHEPSAYSRGMATNMSLNALLAAQDAKATADGKVDIYRTSLPPAISAGFAQFGDYWQDTDDGRWYYCNGSTWVETPDARLPKLVTDLQNTNLTVSAKTRLFYQEGQPTATANGDLWYKPSTKVTRYWNGSGWALLADSTADAGDMLVLNPAFAQHFEHWPQVDAGWYTEQSSNAAFSGIGAVRVGMPTNPHARIRNEKHIGVTPGQRLFISAKIRNLGGGANGMCYAGFLFFDGSGNLIGERVVPWSDGVAVATTEWRNVARKITVPHGSTHAYVTAVCYNHTSGYWCLDDIRAAHVDNVTEAPTSGENMIPNGNFSQNTGGWPVALRIGKPNEMLTDGWKIAEVYNAANTGLINVGLENASHDGGSRQLFIGDMGGTLFPGQSHLYAHTTSRFSVQPGERYIVDFRGQVDYANRPPAGTFYHTYVGLWCYNRDGTRIAYIGWNQRDTGGGFGGSQEVTIPAGTVEVEGIVGVSWHNNNAYDVGMPWAVCHCRFQQVKVRRVVTLDERVIDNGGTYGKISNDDLYDWGGRRRLGLRIRGSRHILAGARNIRAAQVMGFNAIRTSGALTASSAGTISINAHSVELGGETVHYNAVSNAIVGLSQSMTYVVYTLDPYMDGGVRTYYAQTNNLSAAQAGEGAVYMGQVTIPTSGSSGGGGGGGGFDDCVDAEMLLPDGRRAADIKAGDLIPCWNDDPDNPDIEWVEVESNKLVADQPSTYIETIDGAMVIASDSTPMTLRDGRTVRMPEMFGEDVLVSRKGQTPYWSQVIRCVPIGPRTVAKIRVHQRCYLAGVTTDLTIATHNPTMKP